MAGKECWKWGLAHGTDYKTYTRSQPKFRGNCSAKEMTCLAHKILLLFNTKPVPK